MICGLQPVREAIRAHGSRLTRVLVESDAARGSHLEALARFAADQGASVERAERCTLDRMARGVNHQGAIAFAPELPLVPLDALGVDARTLIVALDELQDPQNFGAAIRSAVALGATGVMWPEHRSAPLTAATFRASAGAVEHATLCRVASLPAAIGSLRGRGVTVVGLDPGAETLIGRVDLSRPVAFVVGSEGKGLRKTVKQACDERVRLPMAGPVASLNASVAVAIAIYEAVRQRRRPSIP